MGRHPNQALTQAPIFMKSFDAIFQEGRRSGRAVYNSAQALARSSVRSVIVIPHNLPSRGSPPRLWETHAL